MKVTKGSNKWLRQQARKTRRSKAFKQPSFYKSVAWKRIRYIALKRARGRCQCCGVGPEQGAILNVDHIKPFKRYPELALDPKNLQVLCGSCNQGKGGWDTTYWRSNEEIEIALDIRDLALLRERGLLN